MNLIRQHTALKTLFFILLSGMLSACNSGWDKAKYYNYYSQFKPGSYIKIEREGLQYLLQYRPPGFMALNELKGSGDITQSAFKETLKNYTGGYHFCLRLMTLDTGQVLEHNIRYQGEYYNRIAILNGEFSSLIKGVVEEDDTLYTEFHHYERAYDLRPFEQVLFTISKKEGRLPREIVFDDRIFTGSRVVFQDFKNHLFNQPQLNL